MPAIASASGTNSFRFAPSGVTRRTRASCPCSRSFGPISTRMGTPLRSHS